MHIDQLDCTRKGTVIANFRILKPTIKIDLHEILKDMKDKQIKL